jgi:predicted dehydrogenase
LLGTGYWAAEVHAAAIAEHPKAELVGVWGRAPEKAKAVADRFGARPYDDVGALLADVDAVAIALPPDIQAELAERAAAAGKHLLLEKPIALTVEAADRLVTQAEKTGVASVVFFTKRFVPAITEDIDGLAAHGGWHSARVVIAGSIFEPGNPFGASPWRKTEGGLWDVGPHALSIVLPVLGPVARVSAFTGPRDTTHVLLEHTGGAVSTLTLTLDAPASAVTQVFEFTGEAGIVTIPAVGGEPVHAFEVAIDQLLEAAASGRPHPVGLGFGREVVAILAAADEARRTGGVTAPA